jgi:FMN phosphatase YigB (HAD superfamily)
MPPSVLFFDLDSTLMINPFWKVVFPQVTAEIGAAAGLSPDEVFELILAEHDRRLADPLPDRALTMDWEDIMQTAAQNLGVAFEGSAEELVKAHAGPPHSYTLDGAEKVLGELKAGGYKLVVSTMGLSKYQFPVMRALGLYDFFDDFLTPDLTGYLKTEREFYAAYLESAPRRIHIGDRYDHDCYWPQQFGTRSILRLALDELKPYPPLERPQYLEGLKERISGRMEVLDPPPDAVVVHLAELPGVIAELEARA